MFSPQRTGCQSIEMSHPFIETNEFVFGFEIKYKYLL